MILTWYNLLSEISLSYLSLIANEREELPLNVPNFLTALRMLMVPVYLYFFFSGMENSTTISFGIVLLAGITDVLDGYIARKYKLVTKIGIVLDPLADKLMLVAVLLSLTVKNILPIWILIIVTIKECTMVLGALVLHKNHEVVIPANKYGKVATIAFYVAILTIAIHSYFYMLFMIIFVLLTLFAFWIYMNNYRKIRQEMKDKNVSFK